MTLQEIFQANRPLFYTFYGQVFFLLGVAIALCARRDSEIPLARPLWLLSAFGFAHGLYEWSYVILPVQKVYLAEAHLRVLEMLQRPLEALSFVFLFQFGAEVVNLTRPLGRLRLVPGLLLALWLASYVVTFPNPADDFRHFSNLADLSARYLLCFPGAFLAGGGLFLQARAAHQLGFPRIEPHLRGAAWSFLVYAVVSGLLVPPASFLPASLINRQLLSWGLGLPAPIARAIAGILIAYFVIRSLKMFEIELRRRLEDSRRDLAIAQERERISRELHDGTLQTIYGSGLQLETALSAVPESIPQAKDAIRSGIELLNRAMREIRDSISNLGPDGSAEYEAKIKELIERARSRNGPTVHFREIGLRPSGLVHFFWQHVYYLMQEALSNAFKHSQALSVEVVLTHFSDYLELTVVDNGLGFDAEPAIENPHKRGLNNMRERTEILSGQMQIESSPGKGTRVVFTIPYAHPS